MDRPINIKYTDAQESFGMSGAYLADCYLFDRKLKLKFLADNHIITQDNRYLILNRFTPAKPKKIFGLFTFTGRERDFRIIVCDLDANCYYSSRQSYEELYLQEMKNNTIHFHQAFHDQLPEFKRTITFSNSNFDKHDLTELYEK